MASLQIVSLLSAVMQDFVVKSLILSQALDPYVIQACLEAPSQQVVTFSPVSGRTSFGICDSLDPRCPKSLGSICHFKGVRNRISILPHFLPSSLPASDQKQADLQQIQLQGEVVPVPPAERFQGFVKKKTPTSKS